MTKKIPLLTSSLKIPDGEHIGMISDLHLCAERPDITGRLEMFLQQLTGALDHLFILGDLFEYWIGDDASEHCQYGAIEQLLGHYIERSQVKLYLMHGNRDFLMGPALAARLNCSLINDPCILHVGSSSLLLAHGDAYCTDDVEHQVFRKLTRQSDWQEEFLRKPIEERQDYARQARYKSEVGKSEKTAVIMDVTQSAIDREMEQYQVNLMIHGHTHRPAVHRSPTQTPGATRIVLGDWYEQSSYLEIVDREIRYSIGDQQFQAALNDIAT